MNIILNKLVNLLKGIKLLTKQEADEAREEFIKTSQIITDTMSKMKSKQEIILYLTSVKDWMVSTIHMARTMLPK